MDILCYWLCKRCWRMEIRSPYFKRLYSSKATLRLSVKFKTICKSLRLHGFSLVAHIGSSSTCNYCVLYKMLLPHIQEDKATNKWRVFWTVMPGRNRLKCKQFYIIDSSYATKIKTATNGSLLNQNQKADIITDHEAWYQKISLSGKQVCVWVSQNLPPSW